MPKDEDIKEQNNFLDEAPGESLPFISKMMWLVFKRHEKEQPNGGFFKTVATSLE